MSSDGSSPEQAVPISEVTQLAKSVVEGAFPPIWMSGEVTNFTRHRNGHWYFSLRDASAQLSCVVWSRSVARIPAPPDEGMHVLALGQLSVYPARGQLQCMVSRLEAEGEGLWRKAFEQTRAALERDGLLDPARKRPLPTMPRTVAVVTSPDGAALQDIVSVLRRRNPQVSVVVVPAVVQGEGAPASLVAAMARLARWNGADVAIIGRGGGSREDLWAFNDEGVARALAALPMPTVSAVGHEVDVSITDLVADLRAATPSAAAEAVAPPLDELREAVGVRGRRMSRALSRRLQLARRDLRRRGGDVTIRARRAVERRRASMAEAAARLQALSPLATLARGYAVAMDGEGRTLGTTAAFRPGLPFTLRLRDGAVDAEAR